MESCKFLQGCTFFNDPSVQSFQALFDQLKADYCCGHFEDCARYQIASRLGQEQVPSTMLPTQLQWAEMILRRYTDQSSNKPH
jgi:hypothetical protein